MEGFWNLVKLVVLAAVALTIITNVIQYRRAKRSNPDGDFWEHMEEATQRIRDAGMIITKEDVKAGVRRWAERGEQVAVARKEQAENYLTMNGFSSRGAVDGARVLYEKDGVFYEYNADTNTFKKRD